MLGRKQERNTGRRAQLSRQANTDTDDDKRPCKEKRRRALRRKNAGANPPQHLMRARLWLRRYERHDPGRGGQRSGAPRLATADSKLHFFVPLISGLTHTMILIFMLLQLLRVVSCFAFAGVLKALHRDERVCAAATAAAGASVTKWTWHER